MPSDPTPPQPPPPPPMLDSRDLFTTNREVLIQHGDSRYTLRLTATNKLILVK